MSDMIHDIKSGIVIGFVCFLVTGDTSGSIAAFGAFTMIMISAQIFKIG